jgi:uncharacterized damage-inducible protein DinB
MTKITPLVSIVTNFRETNAEVLKVIHELSDDELGWRPNSFCHSMAFIVWHIARWTDHLQATIPGMTEELGRRLPAGQQVWDKGQFAKHWGLEAIQLGYLETGTDIDIENSGEPNWPKKDVLLNYAQQVFLAVEYAISSIDEEQFQEFERQQYHDDIMEKSRAKTNTVGNAIMEHLIHNVHHMGEFYYLRGLLKHTESGK